jgi:hypothetical protein
MGNRGCLHDASGRIRRPWQLTRWIICLLAFRGRQRQVMAMGRYTELFFLDEATALAAGHRPCAECQRDRFNAYRLALRGNSLRSAVEIDARLHADRLNADRLQRLTPMQLDELPDGAFVLLPEGESDTISGAWPDLAPVVICRLRARDCPPIGYHGRGIDSNNHDSGAACRVRTEPPPKRPADAGWVRKITPRAPSFRSQSVAHQPALRLRCALPTPYPRRVRS